MKKIILSMMVALISLTSFAQQGGGQRREFKPEDMATRRADQVKEAMDKGERPQFDRDAMQKQQEATTAALKEILSAEQFEAYEKAQQERRQRFGQGGQGGRGGRGGRPGQGGRSGDNATQGTNL